MEKQREQGERGRAGDDEEEEEERHSFLKYSW